MVKPRRIHGATSAFAEDRHEPFKSRALFHMTYSEYFKQNVKMFDPLDFIA